MESVVIPLPGEPVGKAARATRGGISYLPAKTKSYMDALRVMAQVAMRGRDPFTGPVRLTLLAEFGIPKSWSIGRRGFAEVGSLPAPKKPDLSNILKGVEDALTGIVYGDDALIVDISARKVYGAEPKITVTIEPLKPTFRSAAEYAISSNPSLTQGRENG